MSSFSGGMCRVYLAEEVALGRAVVVKVLPPDLAAAINVEGAARARLGEFEAAEKLLLASLEGLAGSALPGIEARGRQRLVELYTAWGRPADAARYRSAAAAAPTAAR